MVIRNSNQFHRKNSGKHLFPPSDSGKIAVVIHNSNEFHRKNLNLPQKTQLAKKILTCQKISTCQKTPAISKPTKKGRRARSSCIAGSPEESRYKTEAIPSANSQPITAAAPIRSACSLLPLSTPKKRSSPSDVTRRANII